MEYKKIINFLDNTSNQPSKFWTKKWIEINDQTSNGRYETGSDIKFKTTMLKSSLCDYSNAYIFVKGTITMAGAGADDHAIEADERNKGVIIKNCTPFTKCISEINNIHVDDAKDLNILTPMNNLIEYSVNYSKTSWSLWLLQRWTT